MDGGANAGLNIPERKKKIINQHVNERIVGISLQAKSYTLVKIIF